MANIYAVRIENAGKQMRTVKRMHDAVVMCVGQHPGHLEDVERDTYRAELDRLAKEWQELRRSVDDWEAEWAGMDPDDWTRIGVVAKALEGGSL